MRGDIRSKLVLIGEAPGADEDLRGIPFIGKAGKILTKGMQRAGLNAHPQKGKMNCLVVNALSCRPTDSKGGKNRPPTKDEINNCRPRLEKLLRLVKPKLVILLGNTAAEALFGYSSVPKSVHIGGVTFIKTMHPMYTVYAKENVKEWNRFWRGLKKALKIFKTEKNKPTEINWGLPLSGD